MRKLHLLWILPLVAVLPSLGQPARGQGPNQPKITYARQRQFSFPFYLDQTQASRLRQLQLFFSTDQGRTWQVGATAAPDQRAFNFSASTDGNYIFSVQTTDTSGRNDPERTENLVPQMHVVVDTVPPTVSLQPLAPLGNQVGVRWDIRDQHIDQTLPDAIRLEYRVAGTTVWQPLYCVPGAIQHYWSPGAPGLVDVRIRVRDLAGNTSEAGTQIGQIGQANPVAPTYNPQPMGNTLAVPLDPERKFVNSKQITLDYEIKEQGRSGISSIDLWYTTDGRGWSKKTPATNPQGTGNLAFEVAGEGVYGITLIAKSGVGISAPPPELGEKPQLWVEVDLTKPVVEWHREGGVRVGTGDNKGKLSISWFANDKNLGSAPIKLAFSPTLEGPATNWKSITPGNLANTGNHIWQMPESPDMPWQFYLKVEAIDLAGNVGEIITPSIIKVDTVFPKIQIKGVKGGGG